VNESKTPQSPQQFVYVQQPELDDDEINLLDYWRVLLEHKKLIFMFTALASIASVIAALVMTPIYQASSTLSPVSEEKSGAMASLANQFGGLASLVGVNIGGAGGSRMEEHLAVLKSREFTDAFIKDMNLMPILFEDKWDSDAKKWNVATKEDIPTAWDAYKIFDKIRSIDQDKKTGMVSLSIEWTDPEQAALWVNALVERLNRHQKSNAIVEAEKSIAYLNQQLEQTSVVEMRKSIFNLIEAQTKNIMLANVRDEFAFTVIDPAVIPEEKIKPKRSLIAILGFMVGLMLGVFSAFFVSFIRKQKEQQEGVKS